MINEARTRFDSRKPRNCKGCNANAARTVHRSHRSKSQMAAEDPLAQFRPVSLHPPASLHPAASCVTSLTTLDHPRLQRHPFWHWRRSHSRRGSLPYPFAVKKGVEDCSFSRFSRRLSFSPPFLSPFPLFLLFICIYIYISLSLFSASVIFSFVKIVREFWENAVLSTSGLGRELLRRIRPSE